MIEVFGFEYMVKVGRKPAIKHYVDLTGQEVSLEEAERMCKEAHEKLMSQYPDWTKAERGVQQTFHATIYSKLGYKLVGKSQYTVEIEDKQGNRSDVFQQGDGKWKCLRCQRLTCDHVMWVKSQNPELPKVAIEPVDDILTY